MTTCYSIEERRPMAADGGLRNVAEHEMQGVQGGYLAAVGLVVLFAASFYVGTKFTICPAD